MPPQDSAGPYLSTALSPKSYSIDLTASPSAKSFTGEVTIEGSLRASTTTVSLHARDLKITSATARQKGAAQKGRCRLNKATQSLTLSFDKPLARGPVTLVLGYKGQLSMSMHGLYLAQDGPERAIVSQCEASDARAIFPCLDEPAAKATFAWTITAPTGLTVITNGKLLEEKVVRGKKSLTKHSFAPTRVMSTYLTAVTIGRLEASPTVKVGGIPCRILAGLGKTAQTGFAMEVTKKVLPWYADYFGKPYNYGKLDQVAVPGFDAGAMENVGAIFYRQNLLLMQEGQTSFSGQKRIAEVIAHEIAHQWFGNLVTMQWWDDLWLNEAFATWMAYTVCHDLWPTWHIWDDYLEGKEGALVADALSSTHPIYTPVHNPAEATELFDVITYEKGCAVLRMCEHYLGHKTFRAGIRAYMAKFANKNAQGSELWQALSDAAKKPVGALMHGWIHRPGHPVVGCSQKKSNEGIVLSLSQRRFFAQPAADAAETKERARVSSQPWMIPMVIVYDAGEGVREHRVLFDSAKADVTLPAKAGAKLSWAFINHDATGFYRSHMAPGLQAGLLKHGLGHLSAGAKMALVNDQWALTRAGDASIDQLMPLLLRLITDEDPGVFRSVAGRLRALWAHVVPEDQAEAFSALVRELCRPHIERLGFAGPQGEDPRISSLRSAVVDLLGFIGKDPTVQEEAARQVALEQADVTQVDANIAGSWVSLWASTGDNKRLQSILATYQERKQQGLSPELCSRYLYALCAFEKPKPIAAVLDLCLDGTVPQEQLRVVLSSLLMRKKSGQATWRFLKKHWQDIGPKVGGMGVARLVESTGALPYSHKKDVANFFAKNPVAEAERAVKKAMESFDLWAQLRQRHETALATWIKNKRQG